MPAYSEGTDVPTRVGMNRPEREGKGSRRVWRLPSLAFDAASHLVFRAQLRPGCNETPRGRGIVGAWACGRSTWPGGHPKPTYSKSDDTSRTAADIRLYASSRPCVFQLPRSRRLKGLLAQDDSCSFHCGAIRYAAVTLRPKGPTQRTSRENGLIRALCSEPWGFQYGLAESRTENPQVMGLAGKTYGNCRCGPLLTHGLHESWHIPTLLAVSRTERPSTMHRQKSSQRSRRRMRCSTLPVRSTARNTWPNPQASLYVGWICGV